jgi:hypothetical protein
VRPRLDVPPEYAGWVSIAPGSRDRKADMKAFFFDVSVKVPRDARSGVFRFALNARYADAVRSTDIGATRVRIMTGWYFHPIWRWLLLLLALLALILFSRRGMQQGALRYLHGGHALRFARNLVVLALFAGLVYLGWRWLEGADSLLPGWIA